MNISTVLSAAYITQLQFVITTNKVTYHKEKAYTIPAYWMAMMCQREDCFTFVNNSAHCRQNIADKYSEILWNPMSLC